MHAGYLETTNTNEINQHRLNQFLTSIPTPVGNDLWKEFVPGRNLLLRIDYIWVGWSQSLWLSRWQHI